jgi:hypothetical protein
MISIDIRRKMDAVILARIYNNATGASITHKDIEQWGFLETQEIEHAIEFLGDIK